MSDVTEQVERVIADVGAQFLDRRLNVFDVRVESVSGTIVKLAGRVLEKGNLDDLREAITARLGHLSTDESGVQLLRREDASAMRVVATNLTDLHKEPSFLSELLTQVLNGQALEVLEERDKWALVRQADGYLGWAYQPYLAPAPAEGEPGFTHVVGSVPCWVFPQRRMEEHHATKLLGGTSVRVSETVDEWARVHLAGGMLAGGWVLESTLRATSRLPFEPAVARRQILTDARLMTGVYYLWGGSSAFGIDCSGLTQLTHRLSGYALPRDADLQFAAGTPVEGPPFRPGDLLFFRGESNRNKITHVGIATGDGWRMIHSSRARNGVYEDDVQAVEHLRESYAGARTFIGE